MNLGGEAADQVVRYSLEGIDHGLRLSGTMAKNLAVFLAAVLRNNQKSYGRICMSRMLRENRPLKFFTIPSDRIREFAKEAKKRGLPYVVIRDRKNPKLCELMVFADDAAKVNRVMDQMNLDYVKSENGAAVQETMRADGGSRQSSPEADRIRQNENRWERADADYPEAARVKTETVEMSGDEVQFELSDLEEDFNVGEFPGMEEMENFTPAQEGRSPSGPSSRSKDISTGQEEWNKKPSVRKELDEIKKEKQEAGKKQKERSRGKRKNKNPVKMKKGKVR